MAARRGSILAWAAPALLLGAAGACSLGTSTVPVVLGDSQAVGMKMLRPAVAARACGATAWPIGARGDSPLLGRAVGALLETDPEADMLRDLSVEWRGVDLLLLRVGCVRVRGDVGRMTPVVRLPLVGDHGNHEGQGGHHGGHGGGHGE